MGEIIARNMLNWL